MSGPAFERRASTPEDGIVRIMPRAKFPALCASALTLRGCAHLQCLAILRLSRMRCTHCHEAIEAGERYLVLARDQFEPTSLSHEKCHGATR